MRERALRRRAVDAHADRRRLDRAININEVCDLNPFGPVALIAAYNESEDWLDALNRYLWDNYKALCDFFAAAQIPAAGSNASEFHQVSSLAVCVSPRFGLNCYWNMPFRSRCRVTVENIADYDMVLYYQIDYELGRVEEDCAYFCAQFRLSDPVRGAVHTVLDGVRGRGHYAGTYMAWQPNNNGWWGEGEFKFYLDGDGEFPTVCGTGTEDYFCGAYDFDTGRYETFCTPYSGLSQVLRPDGLYRANTRFGMYRWHIPDPVRFRDGIRVTVQDLGWRSEGRYLAQKSTIASVAYWYQTLPTAPFPPLGSRNDLEVV